MSLPSVLTRPPGGLGCVERNAVVTDLAGGKIRALVTNPETLVSGRTLDEPRGVTVSQLVIDEARCAIEWGESFRPAYLELAEVCSRLAPARVTAFTASSELRRRIAGRLFPEAAAAGAWSTVGASGDRLLSHPGRGGTHRPEAATAPS